MKVQLRTRTQVRHEGKSVRDEGQQRKALFDTSSGFPRRVNDSSEDLPPDRLSASASSRFDGVHEVGEIISVFTRRGFFPNVIVLILGNSAMSTLSK